MTTIYVIPFSQKVPLTKFDFPKIFTIMQFGSGCGTRKGCYCISRRVYSFDVC